MSLLVFGGALGLVFGVFMGPVGWLFGVWLVLIVSLAAAVQPQVDMVVWAGQFVLVIASYNITMLCAVAFRARRYVSLG